MLDYDASSCSSKDLFTVNNENELGWEPHNSVLLKQSQFEARDGRGQIISV